MTAAFAAPQPLRGVACVAEPAVCTRRVRVTALRRNVFRRPSSRPNYGAGSTAPQVPPATPPVPAPAPVPEPASEPESVVEAGADAPPVVADAGKAPEGRADAVPARRARAKAAKEQKEQKELKELQEPEKEAGDEWDLSRYEGVPVRMTGFSSPVVVSEELSALCCGGARIMSRAQIASRLSAYVRDEELKVPEDGRYFRLDGRLRALFPDAPEKLQLRTVTSMLRGHVRKPDDALSPALEEELREWTRAYRETYFRADGLTRRVDRRGRASAKTQVRMKKQGKGLFAPVGLAPELAALCQGEKEMCRPQVTRLVWKYIKDHKLQDKAQRRMIRTDEAIKNLCGGLDVVDCFELSKYVSQHMKTLPSTKSL